MPQGGDERRGQMPGPPSTLQHFSLIAESNSAGFFVSSNVFFCNSARILILKKSSRRDDMPQFMVLIVSLKLLTLKLIECCKTICYG